jgi:GT2 family glycosyltransferase
MTGYALSGQKIERRWKGRMQPQDPDFTVVIPSFERPGQLQRALAALRSQTLPPDRFEIIVVNDGGTKRLEAIVGMFSPALQIRLLQQPNAGPGAARNRALTHARCCWIAFMDDDCEPAADWLETLGRAVAMRPEAMVGGSVRNALTTNVYSAASQRIGDIVYAFYNADPLAARFFSSNNMAAPACSLRELGGFDESFRVASEDRDLCERWRVSGRPMVYVPEAVVFHSHVLTFATFCRQHFRYGQGAARFHRRRAATGSSTLNDHVAFHRRWRQWLFDPWRESHDVIAVRTIGALTTWQITNAAGFIWESLRGLIKQSPKVSNAAPRGCVPPARPPVYPGDTPPRAR